MTSDTTNDEISLERVVAALQVVLAARRAARNDQHAQQYSRARRPQRTVGNAALPTAGKELCTAATR